MGVAALVLGGVDVAVAVVVVAELILDLSGCDSMLYLVEKLSRYRKFSLMLHIFTWLWYWEAVGPAGIAGAIAATGAAA